MISDINECEGITHNCSSNADCNNTQGSYNCSCKPGYTGNGWNCKGNQYIKVFGTFRWMKKSILTKLCCDGWSRVGSNYKTAPSHDALQVRTLLRVVASVCTPLPTRRQQLPTLLAQQCWELLRPFARSLTLAFARKNILPPRISRFFIFYRLSINLFTCNLKLISDIDECVADTHNCSSDAFCNNTHGSFNCSCKPGYKGDGQNCTGSIQSPHQMFCVCLSVCFILFSFLNNLLRL